MTYFCVGNLKGKEVALFRQKEEFHLLEKVKLLFLWWLKAKNSSLDFDFNQWIYPLIYLGLAS